MDKKIMQIYTLWMDQQMADPDIKNELEQIKNNENCITDRFYKELEFGTGGLRGIIGAGTNRMNIYTVGKATQGYSNYLKLKFNEPSVAIAYDSRNKSELFAKQAAMVFSANKIKTFIFKELMPTPLLSFAIRYLNCSGGIVVTASHNPAKYNGYKVYDNNGCQITLDMAQQIQNEINAVNAFSDVNIISFNEAILSSQLNFIPDKVTDSFIQTILNQSLFKRDTKIGNQISIAYTPLNGTGLKCVSEVLKQSGFDNVILVKEQSYPDGDFPTCPYPNPEIPEAMALGIQYAQKTGCDLLLATDPDCDRVGVALSSPDGYKLIGGNEMGILLFDYICKRRIALGNMPKKPVLVKTIVTTDLVKKIAVDYHVRVIDVLTGFKFIGEQIEILEQQNEKGQYIFGFEESYGYLSGGYVRDKDAVCTSMLICEMLLYYKVEKKTLFDVLNDIYVKYGYCKNSQQNYVFEGMQGLKKMQSIMSYFQDEDLKNIAGKQVLAKYDYEQSVKRMNDGACTRIDMPKSNVLKFVLEGESSIVIRPSGTEPKLKVYLSVTGKSKRITDQIESEIQVAIEKLLSNYL